MPVQILWPLLIQWGGVQFTPCDSVPENIFLWWRSLSKPRTYGKRKVVDTPSILWLMTDGEYYISNPFFCSLFWIIVRCVFHESKIFTVRLNSVYSMTDDLIGCFSFISFFVFLLFLIIVSRCHISNYCFEFWFVFASQGS